MIDRAQPSDHAGPYWNIDEPIGEIRLRGEEPCVLRLLAHVSEQPYRLRSRDELLPIKQPEGVRTHVNGKPYILVARPARPAQENEYAYPAFDPTGTVAPAIAGAWRDGRTVWLGCAQAYYYHEARIITVQEAFLGQDYRRELLPEDLDAYALWQGFEQFLNGRFPVARIIATTVHDSPYTADRYQEFLSKLGYWPLSSQAYGKELA